MGYDFRLAKNNEIDTIFSLYKKRIQWMDKSGIQQWNMTNYLEVYPISYYADRQRLGELYVLRKEDVVIGAVVLLQSDECWPQMADSPAYYVHNLVTELSVKGAGKIILSEVEKMAIRKGIQFLRLDCAVDNKFLNEYYESMGYKMVGWELISAISEKRNCTDKSIFPSRAARKNSVPFFLPNLFTIGGFHDKIKISHKKA